MQTKHNFMQPWPAPWRNEYLNGLPGVPLADHARLPLASAVYFVYDNPDEILYIGKTLYLRHRWSSHHRMFQLLDHGDNVWIRYIRVPYTNPEPILDRLERWCIRRFRPLYNYKPLAELYVQRLEQENATLRRKMTQAAADVAQAAD
jgi:hypothetical protein